MRNFFCDRCYFVFAVNLPIKSAPIMRAVHNRMFRFFTVFALKYVRGHVMVRGRTEVRSGIFGH